jgi:hypothetical protein
VDAVDPEVDVAFGREVARAPARACSAVPTPWAEDTSGSQTVLRGLFVVAVPGIRLAKSPSHTRPRSTPEVPMGTGGGPAKFEINPKPYGPEARWDHHHGRAGVSEGGVIRSDIRPHASGLGVTTSAARLVQIMVTPQGADRARASCAIAAAIC